MEDKTEEFYKAVESAKVPVLTLDQKWHRLFALSGKPESVLNLEEELNSLLQEQGRLNEELRELKRNKNKLMESVMANMDGTEAGNDRGADKLDQDKNGIDEVKASIDEKEDEISRMPAQIREVNNKLMAETMAFCYEKLRTNNKEAKEIGEWISKMRIDLKKNIIRKQNRDINSRQIYNYMHSLFGPDVMEIFDLMSGEVDMPTLTAPPQKKEKPANPATAANPAEPGTASKMGDGSVKTTSEKTDDQRKKENFK